MINFKTISLSIISTLIFSFIFIFDVEASIYNYKSKFQYNDPNNGITFVKCKQNNWVKKKACQAKEAAEKKARQAREKAAAAARAAEAARQRAEAEARRRAEEAARRAAAEAKKRAEEAARRAAAEAKKKAEQAAAASKKAAEKAKKQAAKAAKAAGAGLSAAYLASYKHVTPYANSTAELAKDIGNDAAKFVKNQFDKWGCYATVASVTQQNTATALLKKLIPILKKEMKNNLKMATYDYNNYNNQNVSFVSNLNGPGNFLPNDTFSNERGIINASLLNPLSSIKTPKFIDDENGLIEINKKKKKKKCGKRCKKKKRKAKERAKKQNLKKKAEQKRLAKENKKREKAVAKQKKLTKGAVAAGTGTAVIVGSAAAAAGYGKSYKPVKIDTSSPEKMAASTFAVIKRNTTGYGQLLKGGGNLALNATRIYSEVLNAEFLCNKTTKQQIKILKSYKIFPKKGIKFASANTVNNNFAFLDNIKDIKLRNFLISKAYAADGGKANDPAEPFFGLELGAGVSGDMGFGAGASMAFNIVTDMDDEVYSFFTVSIDQLFDFASIPQEPEACVGATLRVFGTPPTKVNTFKGMGHSVGFSVGPKGETGFAKVGAAIGLDVGISSLKSGSEFTGLAIGPEVSACRGAPTNLIPVAAALNASTSWSYRLW